MCSHTKTNDDKPRPNKRMKKGPTKFLSVTDCVFRDDFWFPFLSIRHWWATGGSHKFQYWSRPIACISSNLYSPFKDANHSESIYLRVSAISEFGELWNKCLPLAHSLSIRTSFRERKCYEQAINEIISCQLQIAFPNVFKVRCDRFDLKRSCLIHKWKHSKKNTYCFRQCSLYYRCFILQSVIWLKLNDVMVSSSKLFFENY